jgi:hypothetical protein
MSDPACSKCGNPIVDKRGFEMEGVWYCSECFVEKAQSRKTISKKDLERVRKAAKEEFGGLLPRQALRDLVQEAFENSLKREMDTEAVLSTLVNDIERMAGLSLCRELLVVIKSMENELGNQHNEIEQKIRRISQI